MKMKIPEIKSKSAIMVTADEELVDQIYDDSSNLRSDMATTTTAYPPVITTINFTSDIIQQIQQQPLYMHDLGSIFTASLTQFKKERNDAVITSPLLLEKSTEEEKRQLRLLRNRVAAKECRKKKKLYIHKMEGTIIKLQDENLELRRQVKELREKLTFHLSTNVYHSLE
ncbi:uncharacterized protein BX663DRAFT_491611 [Cokeromyces recurvatus]|uniref:uncharacterized protein n=1 Tax=Cokeromyces recurvatus TaxID=90255 RepID=UPI00221FF54E|nr:uncharacterized protein BX663DRAFT_491611 [Cokeromyces recurvatus]KAI7907662.1 hypothetical protein BX663DRAFT_491611 [Cokeromyces recurvatus]